MYSSDFKSHANGIVQAAVDAAVTDSKPLAMPRTRTHYVAPTFGWILERWMRRADSQHRTPGFLVREEMAQPLGSQTCGLGFLTAYAFAMPKRPTR